MGRLFRLGISQNTGHLNHAFETSWDYVSNRKPFRFLFSGKYLLLTIKFLK